MVLPNIINLATQNLRGMDMADYREMYYTLCAGVSKVLDDMPDREPFTDYYRRLEALLREAEEIYIETANVIDLPEERTRKK